MSQQPTRTTRLVLFDLDGVLTKRDTFATLVARRLTSQPWRLLLALPALPILLLSVGRPRLRGAASRLLVRVALLGVSMQAGRRESVSLGAEFASTSGWLRGPALARLAEHLTAGDRVVVVTATETRLARALLDGVGLVDVELVASDLAAARTGLTLRPHNYGTAKVEALAEVGIYPPWDAMYSDSLADLELLRRASNPVLVLPSRRCVQQVTRALGRRPSEVQWH